MIADEVSFAVPFCDRRLAIVRLCPAVCAVLLATAGCSAGRPAACEPDPECGEVADSGRQAVEEDGGPGLDLPDASSSIDAGVTPPERAETDFSADACFNGVDDDGDRRADCEDLTCGATPFCCLGVTSAQCCGAGTELLRAEFEGCVDPTSCGAEATPFGQPLPYIEGGALVPNGGSVSDAGLVLGAPLDGTRERIVLSAEIAASLDVCRDCLDAIGIGIGDALAGDVVSVRADVAVLVRAARRDYALVIAGEVIGSAPLTDALAHEYTLALAPDGRVSLAIDAREVMTAEWSPRTDRRALIYGRTANRPAGAPSPARATRVSLSAAACEIPSALSREPAALLPPWSPLGARAPSAAADGDGVLVAFEIGGAIHLARPDAAGGWTLGGTGTIDAPVLVPRDGEAYRDPELVRETDRWVLYVTREHDGTRSIARSLGADEHGETFAAPIDLQLDGVGSLSSPSVARFGGETLLAAVAEIDGEASVVLLQIAGDRLALRGGDLMSQSIVRARGGVSAFDADEVGGPALFVDGANILRLYYAGRRGSRWSIGMLASGDGRSFPYAPSEPVLRGSGAGHDALGVLDPSVIRRGDELHLFHTATDGMQPTIARAVGGTRW